MNKCSSLLLLGSLFFITNCSTSPKFEKSNGSSGYTVKELTSKNHFEITLLLPSDTSKNTLKVYGWRAIGEECLNRGFEFFDISDEEPNKYVGFCYPTNERKALAITFKANGLQESPRKFVVEDLNSKSVTNIKIDDEVLAVAGQKLVSMGQLKSVVFASTQKSNSMSVSLLRNGKPLEINEPVALLKSGILGKADLENLRREIQ
jgi:hypothetical protein